MQSSRHDTVHVKTSQSSECVSVNTRANHLNIVKDALKLAERPETEWTAPFQSTEKTVGTYRCFETNANYYGYEVRLIVVESSALDKRKEHTLAKRIAMETSYQVALQTTANEEAVALERRRVTRFVLATTLPEEWLDRSCYPYTRGKLMLK